MGRICKLLWMPPPCLIAYTLLASGTYTTRDAFSTFFFIVEAHTCSAYFPTPFAGWTCLKWIWNNNWKDRRQEEWCYYQMNYPFHCIEDSYSRIFKFCNIWSDKWYVSLSVKHLLQKILIMLIDSMSLEQTLLKEGEYSKMWYVREKDGTTYKIWQKELN